jgi:hypothetical protein
MEVRGEEERRVEGRDTERSRREKEQGVQDVDPYVGDGEGKNVLGTTLMQVRDSN